MTDVREQTEKAADRIRSELMSTLQELDRRRRVALDLRYQVRQHSTGIILVAAGALLATGAGVTIAIIRARHRRANMFSQRIAGFLRAWENPNRIANSAPAQPISAKVMRKFAITFAAALAIQLARRSARRLLPTERR